MSLSFVPSTRLLNGCDGSDLGLDNPALGTPLDSFRICTRADVVTSTAARAAAVAAGRATDHDDTAAPGLRHAARGQLGEHGRKPSAPQVQCALTNGSVEPSISGTLA